MKMIKKLTALVLVALTVLGSGMGLVSCANVSEAEVLKAFKELYEKSVELNEIIYGDGLPCGEAYSYEGYGKVADDAPYKTEKELKEAVLSVYSTGYYNSSIKFVLFGTTATSGSQTAAGARYRTDKDGKLEVFTEYVKFSELSGNCIIEEAKVEATWPDVIVSVPVEFDGVRRKERHEVTMVQEENGAWRYDTISQVGASNKDDNVVLAEFKKLYPLAEELNGIILGAGLPYDGEYDISALESPFYVPVSAAATYRTRSDLEKAIKQVYSKEFFDETIMRHLYGNPEIATSVARYKEIDGVLNINVCDDGQFDDMIKNGCNIELAEVTDITLSTAEITLPYTVDGEVKEKVIFMVKQDGAWRLDSYSFVRG